MIKTLGNQHTQEWQINSNKYYFYGSKVCDLNKTNKQNKKCKYQKRYTGKNNILEVVEK